MYKGIATFVFLLISVSGFSQNVPFSKEQQDKFTRQAKDYLQDFVRTVILLSDPKKSCDATCQEYRIQGTEDHFIKGAKIQTISLNNKNPRSWPVSQYLRTVVNNYKNRYRLVIVKFNNIVIDSDKLQPIGNNMYKMKGSLTQEFCVKNAQDFAKESNTTNVESFTICEETQKEFEVIIKKQLSASLGERWVVLLGDVNAKTIKNLKGEK